MVSKNAFALAAGLGSFAAAAPATTYACNPAHSYPDGVSCISTNGALTLATPAPTAATTYACNPAHSYPNGVSCISTNGALTLATPAPTAATTYACNPAHSYPNGVSCISANGALTLATLAPTATGQSPRTGGAGSNPTKLNKSWTVSDLTRYCGEGNTGCDYNFAVEHDGQTDRCTVIRMPGGNAATESWSNQNCTTGSNLKISWGYVENPAPAYAVMTVVDGKELAWFGVSNVNGQKVSPSSPFGSGEYGNITEAVYTY